MKKRYFKYVDIDKKIISRFLTNHPIFNKYLKVSDPFYVRVSKKMYPGLIHSIISQNESNENVILKWNQLTDFVKKMKPEKINDLSMDILNAIFGQIKARLIKQITNDIVTEKLNLKELSILSEQEIIDILRKYDGLTINTIKTFELFSCFKQNVLCDEDPDFIKGLKVYLGKENVEHQDINNIKIEYEGELTLFSLCMWKIRNERSGK